MGPKGNGFFPASQSAVLLSRMPSWSPASPWERAALPWALRLGVGRCLCAESGGPEVPHPHHLKPHPSRTAQLKLHAAQEPLGRPSSRPHWGQSQSHEDLVQLLAALGRVLRTEAPTWGPADGMTGMTAWSPSGHCTPPPRLSPRELQASSHLNSNNNKGDT